MSGRKRGSRRALVGLTLLAVTAALYLTSPRPNQLVPYTTPPLNEQGDRVSLLIPPGWEPGDIARGIGDETLVPTDRCPDWLKAIGIGRPEPGASLHRTDFTLEQYGQTQQPAPGRLVVEHVEGRRSSDSGPQPSVWVAMWALRLPDHRGVVLLDYGRSNKAAFDATHEAIFRSAHIIPGHGK